MGDEPRQKYTFMRQLTLLFIGLKLTHYIDWPWWQVLSPMWGGVLAVILLDSVEKKLEEWIARLNAWCSERD